MGNIQKVVILGSGNVATHLALALRDAGRQLVQVYSRSQQSAAALSEKLECGVTNSLDDLAKDADLYIMAVSDDAIEKVTRQFPFKDALLVHTSGSTPLGALHAAGLRTGVFYPLQTFSKDVSTDFSQVPLCLEASNPQDLELLEELAKSLSTQVYRITTPNRRLLHVAAVFVCNFSNHMYTLGADILATKGLEFDMLRPLIAETARKAMAAHPSETQTGPALRNDKKTLMAHNHMLEGLEDLQKLYNFITQSIIDRHGSS